MRKEIKTIADKLLEIEDFAIQIKGLPEPFQHNKNVSLELKQLTMKILLSEYLGELINRGDQAIELLDDSSIDPTEIVSIQLQKKEFKEF